MKDNVILTLLFIIFGYLVTEMAWKEIVVFFLF